MDYRISAKMQARGDGLVVASLCMGCWLVGLFVSVRFHIYIASEFCVNRDVYRTESWIIYMVYGVWCILLLCRCPPRVLLLTSVPTATYLFIVSLG